MNEEMLKITEARILAFLEALSKIDMVEIKKGGKYKVISNSGTDEPMITDGEFFGYTILGEEGALSTPYLKLPQAAFRKLLSDMEETGFRITSISMQKSRVKEY